MKTNLFDQAFPFMALFRKQAGTLEAATQQLAGVLNAERGTGNAEDHLAVRGLSSGFRAEPCGRITALVSEGGTTCREIERQLSLTFIQPLDREDIRELNRAFERTLQAVGAVSSRLGLYGFREVQKGAGDQAACLAEMAAQIAPLLQIVVRKGTGAANFARVRKLKREADSFLLVGMGEIFERGTGSAEPGKPSGVPSSEFRVPSWDVLDAMKWSQIYDRLEEVASCLERTVNVIEGIILKKV
jgi:uncharacterized protein